ncbi:probable tRNA (uracil-O(2)-)-methyltransferase isoform X1 [Halyomorpha halys]|uniref:probable tRNA (uracil-O(2)-)-methyltransferase isoform X1 n=1 Tax=Halyomorpha halys TaxID=286706 RepID=UPI0006D4CE6F|nr:probable tRNA (uracil-O(2)-)-methyltransferase [Halyomorpha halys]
MDLYNWEEKFSISCIDNCDQFWSSINIWITKPHCISKKIGGVDCFKAETLPLHGIEEFKQYLADHLASLSSCDDLRKTVQHLVDGFFEKVPKSEIKKSPFEIILRLIYPKNGQYIPENVELIIKDFTKLAVVFIKPITGERDNLVTNLPYAILFQNKNLVLSTVKIGMKDDSLSWLEQILLPKLCLWMDSDHNSSSFNSNQLISMNKYLLTYSSLKDKYFSSILKFWNESTNPEKFINEDIAIASYLLVLWGDKCQNFVDVGCGNGLLVYILAGEGHKGIGIDVRARKIWNSYPDFVKLKVDTIRPSLDCVFPEADWVIGNHSDELTPWIPIIASRSSFTTNFFLLPCCPFELNGQKYIRNNTSKSCYSDYMDYLENICSICGIEVERDRLKIPSTKRLCLVGKKRLYQSSEQSSKQVEIGNFVNLKVMSCGELKMKLRSSEEKVKNCTQLNKKFLAEVVFDIADYIIKSDQKISSWREGEFVSIRDLASLLSPDRRKFLKDQCGGLQTLLRNHHHVFLVCNGRVKLRKPTVKKLPPKTIKQKKCWFFYNHPESCPLSDEHCTYKHLS